MGGDMMQRHCRRLIRISLCPLLFAVGSAGLAAAGDKSAIFTEAQAAAGKQAYQRHCAMCHGADLMGPAAPALVGTDVMDNFETVAGLYQYIAVAMPPQAPGQLAQEEFVQIVAYILAENGAAAGIATLTADPEQNRTISLREATRAGRATPQGESENGFTSDDDVPQAFTWGKDLPRLEGAPTEPAS